MAARAYKVQGEEHECILVDTRDQAVDAQRFPERKTQDLEPLEFEDQD